jgi:hypothetical protein
MENSQPITPINQSWQLLCTVSVMTVKQGKAGEFFLIVVGFVEGFGINTARD